MTLPRPEEPTIVVLQKFARNYESGIQSFLGGEISVNREILAKQGMIGYLWSKWKSSEITYNEVQKATGRANTPIGCWLDGKYDWDRVIERYESALERKIE